MTEAARSNVVDPADVLRRLLLENEALRSERHTLMVRVLALETVLATTSPEGDITARDGDQSDEERYGSTESTPDTAGLPALLAHTDAASHPLELELDPVLGLSQ